MMTTPMIALVFYITFMTTSPSGKFTSDTASGIVPGVIDIAYSVKIDSITGPHTVNGNLQLDTIINSR